MSSVIMIIASLDNDLMHALFSLSDKLPLKSTVIDLLKVDAKQLF